MPSKLYKRGKYWCFPYWEGKGENRRLRWYNTKKESHKEAVGIQADFYSGKLNRESGHIIKDGKWASFVEEYLQYSQANKRPRSVQRDIKTINTFNKLCPIAYFHEFTFSKLEEYKSKRKAIGVKESTINRELNTLKNMGRVAVPLKYSPQSPIEDVRKYKEDGAGKDRILTEKEAQALLAGIEAPHLKTACLFGLLAATRIGEAFHMSWDDIDFKENLIYFTPKDNWRPKTKGTIPLNSELKEYLEKLPRHGKYVCAYENGEIMTEETASALISRRMKQLGIRGATSHTLRHTCLSWAAMTCPWLFVVRLARHTNPKMTMRYAHLSPEFKSNAINSLPRLLDNKKPQQ
jgi:integrase